MGNLSPCRALFEFDLRALLQFMGQGLGLVGEGAGSENALHVCFRLRIEDRDWRMV